MKIPCWKCEQKPAFQICLICLDTGFGELDVLESEAQEELRIYLKLRHAALCMLMRAQERLRQNPQSFTLRRSIQRMTEDMENADNTMIELFARIEEYRRQG